MVKTSAVGQLALFSVETYGPKPSHFDYEVDTERPKSLKTKSTPVARKTVQRVYFWVESYLMRRRYLHYRFCRLRSIDAIDQVEKIHIPGKSKSIREGRVELVKEQIASGSSADAICSLINGWRSNL